MQTSLSEKSVSAAAATAPTLKRLLQGGGRWSQSWNPSLGKGAVKGKYPFMPRMDTLGAQLEVLSLNIQQYTM